MIVDPADTYFSIDVETAGPAPGRYALLSIGACLAADPDVSFYIELQPDRGEATAQALDICGLSLAELTERGTPADEALRHFEAWVREHTAEGTRPVFVAFNAPFDWMFVADYFDRYLGRNPFGHSALDIKALYMGVTGAPWSESRMRHMAERYYSNSGPLTHNARRDAQDQARLFTGILNEMQDRQRGEAQ